MTLVVAQMDEDSIAMVSDTKVTYADDVSRTRRTFENAMPKVVLVNSTLAVGFAGNVDDRMLATVVSLRGQSTDQILSALRDVIAATFLIADVDRMQLWSAGEGLLEERTQLRRAWAGSQPAYEIFLQREAKWPKDDPMSLRLTTSMQFLTSFNVVETVGGYTLTTVGHEGSGFAFVPMPQTTFPAMFDGFSFDLSEVIHLRQLAGTRDSFGAFGLWLANVHHGLLFSHEEPWVPITIEAATIGEFIAEAAASHGQSLSEMS